MGCTETCVKEHTKKCDDKIEDLEDEMRNINIEIKMKKQKVQRFKTQGKIQEAAACLQQIKRLEAKLKRTRNRINKTDRNKDMIDRRQDMAEDIAESKETENLADDIKIDAKAALKTEDNIRSLDEEANELDNLMNEDDTEIMKELNQ